MCQLIRLRFRLSASALAGILMAGVLYAGTAEQVQGASPYGIAELYEIALVQDTELKQAKAAFQAVELGRPIARSRLLPQLSLQGSFSHLADQTISGQRFGSVDTNISTSFNSDSLSLQLSQSLYNRADYLRFRQSDSQIEKSSIELEAARMSLIMRLASAYFDLLTTYERYGYRQQERLSAEKLQEQAAENFRVGMVAITDVSEAEAARDKALSDEIGAENEVDKARHVLSVIVGRPIQRIRHLRENIPLQIPAPESQSAWVTAAEEKNLDLRAAKIESSLALQEIKVQEAGHFPSLSLVAAQSRNEQHGGQTPVEIQETSIGIQLTVPLVSGGSVYYASKQATAQHEVTLSALEQVRRTVQKDASQSYLDILSGIRRIEALNIAKDSAKTALEAITAGFNVGTRTSIDVSVARTDYFKAMRDLADERYQFIISTLKLQQTAGSLALSHIEQIDSWLVQP